MTSSDYEIIGGALLLGAAGIAILLIIAHYIDKEKDNL